jgi:serine/threonine-protein kinase RsbW
MMPSPDHSTAESASIHLPNRRDEIDRAEESLLAALARHGYGDSSRFAVRLAVEEALSNAFNHGHSTLPATTPVRFEYVVTPAEVVLSVEDQGPGFTPEAVPDPTSDENLELPSGRGLLLMRAYMASVEYSGRGNIVKMVYRKPPR